ncbi:MAG TPA: DUF3179 domain-containing protein [Calditrichaeota bacterium]|nr:DUF3179 domain-containing protein [Calditrichota bacterium]
MKRTLIISTGILMSIISYHTTQGQPAQAKVVAVIDGDEMYQVLPPDDIPAIRQPQFLSGNEADKQMSDEEPVIALRIGGEARAYSLWQLDHHEIVNDFVGETPIAVTW